MTLSTLNLGNYGSIVYQGHAGFFKDLGFRVCSSGLRASDYSGFRWARGFQGSGSVSKAIAMVSIRIIRANTCLFQMSRRRRQFSLTGMNGGTNRRTQVWMFTATMKSSNPKPLRPTMTGFVVPRQIQVQAY